MVLHFLHNLHLHKDRHHLLDQSVLVPLHQMYPIALNPMQVVVDQKLPLVNNLSIPNVLCQIIFLIQAVKLHLIPMKVILQITAHALLILRVPHLMFKAHSQEGLKVPSPGNPKAHSHIDHEVLIRKDLKVHILKDHVVHIPSDHRAPIPKGHRVLSPTDLALRAHSLRDLKAHILKGRKVGLPNPKALGLPDHKALHPQGLKVRILIGHILRVLSPKGLKVHSHAILEALHHDRKVHIHMFRTVPNQQTHRVQILHLLLHRRVDQYRVIPALLVKLKVLLKMMQKAIILARSILQALILKDHL